MSTSASPKLEKKTGSPLLIKTFKEHGVLLHSIACSKDGKRIISGSRDRMVRMWNLESLQPEGEILMHDFFVREVILSPDDRRLLCAGEEHIQMWDLEGESVVWRKKRVDWVRDGVVYSPDGQLIAAPRGEEILLLDVETGDCIRELQFGMRVMSVAFSPDGTRIAAWAWDGDSGSEGVTLSVFDVATGETTVGPFETDGTRYVRRLAFTNDGQQIIAFASTLLHVWNAATGRKIGDPIPVNQPLGFVIAMSPDGRRAACMTTGGTVSVYDLVSRRQIGGPLQGKYTIRAFAWSRNSFIVTGDYEGNIQLWDVSLLDNVSTSILPVPHIHGTSPSRPNSISSSILNLPAGPQPMPQSPEMNTGADENDNREYDTDASFDSLLDLPADGTQPVQRRKRRCGRNAPVTSPASPSIASTSLPTKSQQHQVPPAITDISSPNPRHPLQSQPPAPPGQPTSDTHTGAKGSPLRGAASLWTRNRRNPRDEQPAQPVVPPVAKTPSKSKSPVATTESPTSSSPLSGNKSIISLVRAHLRRDKHITHDSEGSPRVHPQAARLLKYSPVVKVSPAQAFSRIAKARPREWDKRRPRRVVNGAPQEPGQELQGQEQAQGQLQAERQAQAQGDSTQAPGLIQHPSQSTASVPPRVEYEWVRPPADDEPEEDISALADVEVGCWDLFRAAIEYTFTRRKDRQESE